MAGKEPVKLAILDDYASVASQHFSALQAAHPNLEIQCFPGTLNAKLESEHAELISRLKPFTIISSMRERTQFPRSVLSQLPQLKLLVTTGMRNAAIDVAAATELGITVVGTKGKSNATPGYDATNEQAWTLILGLAKDVVGSAANVTSSADGRGWQTGLVSALGGKTLGLLGLGKLGTQAAVTGKLGFGMNVLAWSTSLTQEKADEAAASRGLAPGSFKVAASKEDLFRQADVLSVHYVLSPRSRGIVAAKDLALMKSNAILINTSRGPLIDENDLLEALEKGKIHGVGLDVFETEPLPKESPWRRNQYWGKEGRSLVLVSPHNGYVESETMNAWYKQQAETVGTWITGGEVQNRIQ
ncbi:hypothetical protein LTR84_006351 [Exophiala bonariae]|uniref:D-isomer specific 2-hydroxyacid dehydrogenase NAD-binding domain-containing protein n=1 Tax=Exophiala bonariae TaxID=1690606 RepID=A0AAV9N122_9EURO|nr:hypothetical protein LTR84_006351 [Exophiala bonariae]